jgi:uncharacterized integral membrane protein
MNSRIKLVLGLSLIGLVLVFILQNVALVAIRYFFWTISMSGALLFFLLFIAGTIFGWLLLSYLRHQEKNADRITK